MLKKLNEKFYIAKTDDAQDLSTPRYMSQGAAGMDLYANVQETTIVPIGKIKLIPTGIRISLPEGYEAQIRPRSGLALNSGISIVNSPGTIDSDYRGEIKVILINFGEQDFIINRGDRIAQMVVNKIEQANFELTQNLDETERGAGAFGSTGKA